MLINENLSVVTCEGKYKKENGMLKIQHVVLLVAEA
jgi:hypothetical protein